MLVETGSQSSVPALLAALDDLGVDANDLAGVAVTHIHLDHAGGVGDVARAFPNATVYVHEKGARHLVDPSRLVDSAAQVYGDLLDTLYGRLDPTPAERVHVLEDGEEIQVSAQPHAHHRRLARPRQAPPRRCTTPRAGSSSSATPSACACPTPACCGRRRRRPTSTSTRRCTRSRSSPARSPSGIALAHYGLVPDPATILEEAAETLTRWAEVAETGVERRAATSPPRSRPRSPATSTASTKPDREKLETLNGVHSNAAGFRRWLETRDRPHARTDAIKAVVFDWGGTLTEPAQLRRARPICGASPPRRHRARSRGRVCARRLDAVEAAAVGPHRASTSRRFSLERHAARGFGRARRRRRRGAAGGSGARTTSTGGRRTSRHDPEAAPTLAALKGEGLRIGLLSNTHWPRTFHEHFLERDGPGRAHRRALLHERDGRAPSRTRRRSAHVLDELGVAAADAVFVGDRLYDDIYGRQDVGMRSGAPARTATCPTTTSNRTR